jgi:hypothetical protein
VQEQFCPTFTDLRMDLIENSTALAFVGGIHVEEESLLTIGLYVVHHRLGSGQRRLGVQVNADYVHPRR